MASPETEEAAAICLLMLEGECSSQELQDALKTLHKILTNVRNNPTEEKYRTIKKENKAFKEKVWRFEGCQQFLFSTGWIEVDETIVLPDETGIEGPISTLEAQLRLVPSQSSQAAPPKETIKSSWSEQELKEKERKLQEERQRMLHKIKREKEEKKRIADAIKADRQDRNTKEMKDSKARERRFGANIKKFSDIGVDLNRGGG